MNPNEKIESLLKTDPSKVTVPALKAALVQHQKDEAEKQNKLALEYLRIVDRSVNSGVENLREARTIERKAKERLEKLVAAKDAFLASGDFVQWQAAVRAIEVW